jgi:hypothetical protein
MKEPVMLEQLRRAIRESEYTPYAIERETGVLRGSTLRFLRGEHVLSGTNFCRIAELLGLELRPIGKGRKGR